MSCSVLVGLVRSAASGVPSAQAATVGHRVDVSRRSGDLRAAVRRDDHDHVAAVLLRRGLDEAELLDVLGQALQQPEPQFGPGLLAAAEHDRDLHLVALLEEPLDVTLLGLVVVRVDLRAELHLFDDGQRLVAPGLTCLLRALVLELAVVHELADGRTRHRGDLDEIQVGFGGEFQGLADRHDADLLALGADEAYLGDADPVVDPGFRADGTSLVVFCSVLRLPAPKKQRPRCAVVRTGPCLPTSPPRRAQARQAPGPEAERTDRTRRTGAGWWHGWEAVLRIQGLPLAHPRRRRRLVAMTG